MEPTEKLLETTGVDADTASVSAAEHTPAPVQDPEGLVLEMFAGGAIDAKFVTCV